MCSLKSALDRLLRRSRSGITHSIGVRLGWINTWWKENFMHHACKLLFFTWLLTVNNYIKVRLWLASGQVSRRSQGTLLPSSGAPKVSNPWNKCVTQNLI
jgi:hypothetical protein